MTIRLLSLFICLFTTASLAGQLTWLPELEVTAGMTTYTPYDDFSREILTINGRPFTQGRGNVAEPTAMPFLRIGLANKVGDRWEVSPYLEYHAGTGTLFEQDFYQFIVSDFPPDERRYTFPAANSMRMFAAGIDARYVLLHRSDNKITVGTGLAFIARSHTYREALFVDFGTTRELLSVGEEFITLNRTAAAIPLSAELEHQLTARFSVGLHSRLQFQVNNEDLFWSAGLRCGMRL